ncbi:MAG: hypothetical protein H7177_17620 [Rhizobacter sp.]|nr:hypothetical protein [Bacteriovorax sp.]
MIKKLIRREINGRWFLGGSHVTLFIICLVVFELQRSWLQIAFGYFCGLLTEFILYKTSDKYPDNKTFDRLFSAFTEVAGLIILIKSHKWWLYGLLGFFAVVSKYFIRRSNNSHLFNPTNFAIVISLIFLPTSWFGAWADEYMYHWYPMLHVTVLGLIAVWLGRTYTVSFSYILSVIFWCAVFFPLHDLSSVVYAFAPEFGAIGLIFLWLMITDPKTAPASASGQMTYAFSIAFLHIYLRSRQYLYSRYISLFIITLLFYAINVFWFEKRNQTVSLSGTN